MKFRSHKYRFKWEYLKLLIKFTFFIAIFSTLFYAILEKRPILETQEEIDNLTTSIVEPIFKNVLANSDLLDNNDYTLTIISRDKIIVDCNKAYKSNISFEYSNKKVVSSLNTFWGLKFLDEQSFYLPSQEDIDILSSSLVESIFRDVLSNTDLLNNNDFSIIVSSRNRIVIIPQNICKPSITFKYSGKGRIDYISDNFWVILVDILIYYFVLGFKIALIISIVLFLLFILLYTNWDYISSFHYMKVIDDIQKRDIQ